MGGGTEGGRETKVVAPGGDDAAAVAVVEVVAAVVRVVAELQRVQLFAVGFAAAHEPVA